MLNEEARDRTVSAEFHNRQLAQEVNRLKGHVRRLLMANDFLRALLKKSQYSEIEHRAGFGAFLRAEAPKEEKPPC